MSETSTIKRISRLSLVLQALVMLTFALIAVLFVAFVTYGGDFYVGATLIQSESMSLWQRIGFALTALLPLLAVCFIFVNLWKLASLYRKGIIFDRRSTKVFKRFALGLVAWGILDLFSETIQIAYLQQINHWEGMNQITIGLEDLVAGPLFFSIVIYLISMVMVQGQKLADEAEMTI